MRDTDDISSNPTSNPHLVDLIEARLSRRTVIGGAMAAGVGVFLAGGPASRASLAAPAAFHPSTGSHRRLLGFTEIDVSTADTITVPEGYAWDVLIPWGTPLTSAAAAFAEDASNTSQDQEHQVGFNHDGMHFFPLSHRHHQSSRRGLLVLNHEYTDASQIYTALAGSAITPDDAGKEKVAKALAAHGVTVVEVVRGHDGWWSHVVDSPYNRRITGTTPMAFSGPVGADHPDLASTITPSPIGTLNNCAHGHTPWGTYLACEENWNGYFGSTDPAWTPNPLETRYGVTAAGSGGYNWHTAEPRFDLAVNRNELNRFGWVVEVDPFDPDSVPVKRTALGRIKHEGAAITESKGRIAVYMGDDQDGDYVYKFVGNHGWRKQVSRGRSPLDDGVLHVAKFEADGSGTWVPLIHGTGELTEANGWVDQAGVLIRTRQAADLVGATRCHRPEWTTVHPHTGDVYVTFTNGAGNPSPVNSTRDPNPYGHIVRIHPSRGDHTKVAFGWNIFLLAGDPAYPVPGAGVPADQTLFGSPDGLWVDPDGRLWIQTDISNSSQNLASRFYDHIGNNAMLAADPKTGELRRFLTGPRGCEITGVITTPDQRTMFVNVQHPGEATTFWGTPTPANPSAVSTWPFHEGQRPRPATVVIRKKDGGKIGT